MPFYKSTSDQKIPIFAWNTVTEIPATGVADEITGYISLDCGTVTGTDDVSPSGLDDTYSPGFYYYNMTHAESNADVITLYSMCGDDNVKIDPVIIYTDDSVKSEDIFGRSTWYVSKDGNDTDNGGTSWADAELTINAAINNASAGDLILIGPGTYDENVVLTGKTGVELRGSGIGATIVDPATGNGIVMADNCVLKGLSVTADASGVTGVVMGEECVIENCKIHGDRYGVDMDNSDDVIIRDSYILAGEKIVDCNFASRFLITNTKIFCNDEVYSDDIWGIHGLFCSGRVESCEIEIYRTDTAEDGDNTTGCLFIVGAGEHVNFVNVKIYVNSTNASSEGGVVGIYGVNNLIGGSIKTLLAGSGQNISITSSSSTIVNGTSYDVTKIFSRIIDAGVTDPNILLESDISGVTDQTHLLLDNGSVFDDTYNDQTIVLYNKTLSDYYSVRQVVDYTASSKTVEIDNSGDFVLQSGDYVKIFVTASGTAGGGTAPTVGEIRTEMDDSSTMLNVISGYTNNIPTTAEIKTQVVAALSGDTYVEPGQLEPPSTASLAGKLNMMYKYAINKVTNDGSYIRVYDDGGSTVDHKAGIVELESLVTRSGFLSG